MIKRPPREDIPGPFLHYYDQVESDDLLEALGAVEEQTLEVLSPLPPEMEVHRYAPEKWSVREVVGHISDSERVFAYRALRFSRHDSTSLPGFDENLFAPHSGASRRHLSELLGEYRTVRAASVSLLSHLTESMLDFRGTAGGKEVTARALGWIIAGHNVHHLEILRTRYLP
jgi:uncharacterized damage-inducible protein DinB